jgi:hypothetical protein
LVAANLADQLKQVQGKLAEPTPMFDHFTPSAWLIRNLTTLDGTKKTVETTLARAERLFEALNATLT